MGKAQRDKGKRGEREVVGIMRGLGFAAARRARQSDGAVDPDVAGCPDLWIEVKRRKNIAAARYMDQAVGDAKEKGIPTVFLREDGGQWMVMIRADDVPAFAAEIVSRSGERTKHPTTCHEACDLPKRD